MEYDIEKILQTYEDDYNPDPRPMAQEPRTGFKGGSDVETGMGFQKGNQFGRDLKDKPSLNVAGKNQYTPRTTKEIQAIIDANPNYITPKNFYEPTKNMQEEGMKKTYEWIYDNLTKKDPSTEKFTKADIKK